MPTVVKEKIEGNTSKADAKGGATYARVFQVLADDYRLRAKGAVEAVVAFTGIELGSAYEVLDPADGTTVLESDDASFCQEMSAALASSASDGCQWDVTVNYGASGGEAATFPKDPIEHPVKVSWGSERFEISVDRDRDDEPILNSAGDKFDPAIKRDDSRIILKVVRNEATFSPTLAQTWKHTVNDAPFEILGESFDAGTVLINDITGEPVYNAECGWYWPVSYEFVIKPEGWTRKIIEQGMRELNAAGERVTIKDNNGQPITDPVFLDDSGHKLAAAADPVTQDVEIYQESDFSLLNLSWIGVPGYPEP